MQIAGKYRKDYQEALKRFKKERREFEEQLGLSPYVRVIPSQANYVLVELLGGVDADEVKQRMLIDHNIFIKTLKKKLRTNRQYLRIAIRNRDDNDCFVNALNSVIEYLIEK